MRGDEMGIRTLWERIFVQKTEPFKYKAPDFTTTSAWRERAAEWEAKHGRWDLHPLRVHYFWEGAWKEARQRYEAAYPNDTLEAARAGRQTRADNRGQQ